MKSILSIDFVWPQISNFSLSSYTFVILRWQRFVKSLCNLLKHFAWNRSKVNVIGAILFSFDVIFSVLQLIKICQIFDMLFF